MVSVNQAETIINEEHFDPQIIAVSLEQASGKVLAEDVRADRDLPPFNRATMDGIAVASSALERGNRRFRIKGVQPAGVPPLTIDNAQQCIEIMTGAVMPATADVVVRYEDLRIADGHAEILTNESAPGQNIHRQGSDAKKGAVLLKPSQKISPAEIALLASIGMKEVKVFQSTRIAVVSTGNELVPVQVTPKQWQVRISNAHAILAALDEMGHPATHLHISDDEQSIRESVSAILDNHEVIILSGGVSKGKLDLVPGALSACGIEKKFHEVSQRPGKPMWFGRGKGKTVFALPGNPVSTFMCFHRYVKPWLERALYLVPRQQHARLGANFQFNPALTYFLQVNVQNEQGTLIAKPDVGGGSGDFANLRNVDGFLELPLERNDFKAGEIFPYYPFRS